MSEVPPTQPEPTPEPTPEPVAAAETTPPVEPTPVVEPAPASARALGPGPSADEKMQAMLAWLLGIPGLVAPLIFFLISNDKPFVKRQAAKSLGFQIVVLVLWIVSFILTFVLIGALLMPVIMVLNLIVCIMAGMAANRGEDYEIPVVGPMIAKMFNV